MFKDVLVSNKKSVNCCTFRTSAYFNYVVGKVIRFPQNPSDAFGQLGLNRKRVTKKKCKAFQFIRQHVKLILRAA